VNRQRGLFGPGMSSLVCLSRRARRGARDQKSFGRRWPARRPWPFLCGVKDGYRHSRRAAATPRDDFGASLKPATVQGRSPSFLALTPGSASFNSFAHIQWATPALERRPGSGPPARAQSRRKAVRAQALLGPNALGWPRDPKNAARRPFTPQQALRPIGYARVCHNRWPDF